MGVFWADTGWAGVVVLTALHCLRMYYIHVHVDALPLQAASDE